MTRQQYEEQLNRCNVALRNLSLELQRLGLLASDILGREVVAMAASGCEIELRPTVDGYTSEIEDIPMRAEDVLEML